MLAELLENNRNLLQKTNSYLLPQLNEIIGLVTRLEQTAGADYAEAFERMELPKGYYLLRAGTVCRHFWFLEKGLARIFACINGVEVNQYFFFPAEIIDSHGSSSLQLPSEASIQLLEHSVVYRIRKSQIDELKCIYPLISDIERVLIDCYTKWINERICLLLSACAIKRYQALMVRQPSLAKYISVSHLSSYLGMSRETLSRLRSTVLSMVIALPMAPCYDLMAS